LTGNLLLLLWVVLVITGTGTMQWGASRASAALDAYRRRAGLAEVIAGALLGIATASPEISVNIVSVAFAWPDLGLGAALGSNVPALPLVFLLAWLSLRFARAPRVSDDPGGPPCTSVGAATTEMPVPVVAPAAVEVQALPYLLVVLLLAALTLPKTGLACSRLTASCC
jgi:cation:H+ antiporter